MSRYLLDTHSLLWAMDQRLGTLSKPALAAIRDTACTVVVSVASLWELAIKEAIGKIEPIDQLPKKLEVHGYLLLPMMPRHVEALRGLPLKHRDPFDRLLVAQAQADKLTLITRDSEIMAYGVAYLKA